MTSDFLDCISLSMSINEPDSGIMYIGMALVLVWMKPKNDIQTWEPDIKI